MNNFLLSAPIGTVVRMKIISNSMSPYLRINDWVLVKRVPINQVTVGDVVVFVNPSLDLDNPIVHRVVSKTGVKRIVLRTKGDNVGFIDRKKTTTHHFIGVVIKKENRLFNFLQQFFL